LENPHKENRLSTQETRRPADPLVWGHGPKTFEAFLEPTCPFSARAFGKLDELLERAGPKRLTIKVRLVSQPWHLYSPVVTRAILAASTLEAGKTAAKSVMAAVFAHREEFEFTHHCSGPNLDVTPRGILSLIERYSGVAVAAPFEQPSLEADMKWHAKYARQNGIHVSPTFMIDGLVAPKMGSGDTIDGWLGELGLG
jgi:protein-disulfide isomerase